MMNSPRRAMFASSTRMLNFADKLAAYVRRDRVFHALDAVLVLRSLEPCTVRMDRVGRNAENLGADALKLFETVRKMDQLRRADEREIERVKQKDEPFALVIRKLDVLGQRVDVLGRRHVKIRCRLPDLRDRRCSLFLVAVPVAVDMFIYLLVLFYSPQRTRSSQKFSRIAELNYFSVFSVSSVANSFRRSPGICPEGKFH